MKRSELKQLIRETIEEQQFQNELNRLDEGVKDFIVKKAIPAVLKPLISLAFRANPELKSQFANMSEKDFNKLIDNPKIMNAATKRAEEILPKVKQEITNEGGFMDRLKGMDSPKRMLDKLMGSVKSSFAERLTISTLLMLALSVALLVLASLTDAHGYGIGFDVAMKTNAMDLIKDLPSIFGVGAVAAVGIAPVVRKMGPRYGDED